MQNVKDIIPNVNGILSISKHLCQVKLEHFVRPHSPTELKLSLKYFKVSQNVQHYHTFHCEYLNNVCLFCAKYEYCHTYLCEEWEKIYDIFKLGCVELTLCEVSKLSYLYMHMSRWVLHMVLCVVHINNDITI